MKKKDKIVRAEKTSLNQRDKNERYQTIAINKNKELNIGKIR